MFSDFSVSYWINKLILSAIVTLGISKDVA